MFEHLHQAIEALDVLLKSQAEADEPTPAPEELARRRQRAIEALTAATKAIEAWSRDQNPLAFNAVAARISETTPVLGGWILPDLTDELESAALEVLQAFKRRQNLSFHYAATNQAPDPDLIDALTRVHADALERFSVAAQKALEALRGGGQS
jgi:hypothetical protein